MPLSAKVGTFLWSSADGPGTNYAVTGVGFQPKALMLWLTGSSSSVDAAGRADPFKGAGFVTSTTSRRTVTAFSNDNPPTTTQCAHGHREHAIAVVDTGLSMAGWLDFVSFDADGFTLTVTDQSPTSHRVHYLALGGTDLTNVTTGSILSKVNAGSQAYTGVGFQPDAVLFLAPISSTAPPHSAAESHFALGAAVKNGVTIQQAVTASCGDQSQSTSDTQRYAISGQCVAQFNTAVSGLTARAELTSMDADGFTLNWLSQDTVQRYVHYLALRGGRYAIGNILTQLDTVTDITVSNTGHRPVAVLFVSHGTTQSTDNTIQTHDLFSIGAATGASNQGAQGMIDVSGLATALGGRAIEYDSVYVHLDTNGNKDGAMDLISINNGGFTCRMSDADPAQSFVWYLSISGNTDVGGGGGIPVKGFHLRQQWGA